MLKAKVSSEPSHEDGGLETVFLRPSAVLFESR
jgi:hypothetical protein